MRKRDADEMVRTWRMQKTANAARAAGAVTTDAIEAAVKRGIAGAQPTVAGTAKGAVMKGVGTALSDYAAKATPVVIGGLLARMARKKTPWQHVKGFGSDMFGKGSPGRKALAFGAGAGAIGLGIEGASSLHDAIADPLRKRKYMNNMLAENPQLRRESPKDVSKAFNTLYTFNKRMASDPLVSGSFLRRALQFREEGVQAVDIKTLVDAHPKGQDSSRFKEILPSTAKDLMSFVERAGGA